MARKLQARTAGSASRVTELDRLDMHLIDLLQDDGRQPNTELARKLKVTEGTVRNRIARLLDDDLIQVGAWVDPVRIGGQIYAHIEVEVENSRIDAVARHIAHFSEINFESIQTGKADIFLGCFFRSMQHMDEFITRKLAGVKGILVTSSVVVLRIVKRHHRLSLEDNPASRRATKQLNGRSVRRHAESKG